MHPPVDTPIALKLQTIKTIISISLLAMHSTAARAIIRRDPFLAMPLLPTGPMQILIALATVQLPILRAVVAGSTNLAVLAQYLVPVPFRHGLDTPGIELYLVLQAALGFVLYAVSVWVDV